MKRSDLIYTISNMNPELSVKMVHDGVKEIIEHMSKTLANGDRVEIRSFGSFSLHHRESRMGRNPKTGEYIQVKEKNVPFFKASKELKEKIDCKK